MAYNELRPIGTKFKKLYHNRSSTGPTFSVMEFMIVAHAEVSRPYAADDTPKMPVESLEAVDNQKFHALNWINHPIVGLIPEAPVELRNYMGKDWNYDAYLALFAKR